MLLGVAELAEDIDVARAQEALTAAQQRLDQLRGGRGSDGDDAAASAELVAAEAAVQRAQTRLAVAGVATG